MNHELLQMERQGSGAIVNYAQVGEVTGQRVAADCGTGLKFDFDPLSSRLHEPL